MKAVLGLLPLSQGKVDYCGIERNAVGYLPQQTPAQRDFPASVQEVVLSGCLNRRGLLPFYSKAEKLRAAQKIEQLEIFLSERNPIQSCPAASSSGYCWRGHFAPQSG